MGSLWIGHQKHHKHKNEIIHRTFIVQIYWLIAHLLGDTTIFYSYKLYCSYIDSCQQIKLCVRRMTSPPCKFETMLMQKGLWMGLFQAYSNSGPLLCSNWTVIHTDNCSTILLFIQFKVSSTSKQRSCTHWAHIDNYFDLLDFIFILQSTTVAQMEIITIPEKYCLELSWERNIETVLFTANLKLLSIIICVVLE